MVSETDAAQPPVTEGVETEPGPGARLRAAREAMSLSVEEVAKRLRLDTWVIQALEAEDFARLPEPVYVRGYLNAYCKLLNQSPEPLCARLLQSEYRFSALPAGSLVHKVLVSRPVPSRFWPAVAVVLAVAVVGLSFVLLKTGGPIASQATVMGEASSAVPAPVLAPAADASAAPEGAAPDPAAAMPVVASAEPEPEHQNPNETASGRGQLQQDIQAKNVQANERQQGSDTALVAESAGAVSDRAEQAAPAQTPTRGAGPDRVTLHLTEDSWTELLDANGKRLVAGLLKPGVHVFAGTAPFQLTLGRPSGARIEFNGVRQTLPSGRASSSVLRLTLGGTSKPAH